VSGFSLADSAFYEMPGPAVAGLLADLFTGELPQEGISLPKGSVFFRLPTTHCSSLEEVTKRLRAEHTPGTWYRGQTRQRTCLYEGKIEAFEQAFANFPSVKISFEGTIPSSYRKVASSDPAQWDESGVRLTPPLDFLSSAIRSIIRYGDAGLQKLLLEFLEDSPVLASQAYLALAGVTIAKGLDEFSTGTNVLKSHLRLISLSQHYEHGSTMVDVSKSPEIAAWFASRSWSDGLPLGIKASGDGVIYRFHSHSIEKMVSDRLLWRDGAPPTIQGLGLFGLVDISDIDPNVAARPLAQQGGSILGLENSAIYFLLGIYHAAEAFTFPHASVTGREVDINKDDLCPLNDPALPILRTENCDSSPIQAEELLSFLLDSGVDEKRANHIAILRNSELL
jgi:hypothetical protein